MELKDLSYFVLGSDARVKIYLDGVLDEKSKKYYKKQEKLLEKLFNTDEDKKEEIWKEITDLLEYIDNELLFEGLNKDIPLDVLNNTWIVEESIHAENDTLIIPVIKYVRIKDIQDKLKNREYYELDFYDNISIVISNDNIYIKRWEEGNSKYFADLKFWHETYLSDDSKYDYEQIEEYSIRLIDLIGENMRRECKYTISDFGED